MGRDRPRRLGPPGLKRWARIDARSREATFVRALPWQDHVSAAHRGSGAAISQMAVEGQDAAVVPCRKETKPASVDATPVCQYGTAAIFSVF